ncbi:MAG TPA: hypothetical protein VGN02_04085 [Paenibacillus sp.]
MNLIDIYIQEVTRRLPEKDRGDVSLELRSTIEDMLPDEYSEDDVKAVLEKLGNPAVLASGYVDRPMHLIGPRYFDLYVSLLKMILPIAILISVIATVAENIIGYNGSGELNTVINHFVNIIIQGIVGSFDVIAQSFFWLTVVFAIIERVAVNKGNEPITSRFKKWTPDDLKKLAHVPKKKVVSKAEVFGSLFWTAIWATLYFYADRFVGVYKGTKENLEFLYPTFNQEILLRYWPFVIILAGLEVALALYKYIVGHWTKRMALCNTGVQLAGAIFLITILLNPNLFDLGFINYISDLFGITPEQFKTVVTSGGTFLFLITTAISIFDGFRKAKIQ